MWKVRRQNHFLTMQDMLVRFQMFSHFSFAVKTSPAFGQKFQEAKWRKWTLDEVAHTWVSVGNVSMLLQLGK